MPFTLSHPAAAVPLARRGLLLSALVVGSMAPDFGYYLHPFPGGLFSHTLLGVLFFCVPAGLAVLWVFHTFLKHPLLSLLPTSHQRRLAPLAGEFSFGPWRRFVRIVVSLAAGALTHIAWDAFTHSDSWTVQQLPFLRWPITRLVHGAIPLYYLLQYGSTLVGGALLCYWYTRWFRQAPTQPVTLPVRLSTPVRRGVILSMGVGTCILAGMWGSFGDSPLSGLRALRLFATRAVSAGMMVLFAELVIFSGFWHLAGSKKRAQVR